MGIAAKLQRGQTQKVRERVEQTKAERLKALGITPRDTPGSSRRSTPGSSVRGTPASTAKITPLSPIGQLLKRAQKLSQSGGQLRIGGSSSRGPTPTSTPRQGEKRKNREVVLETLPSSITDDLL